MPGPSKRRHLALIGMAGAGKSAVSRQLASRLDLECVDIDALIVERAHHTIPEIFASQGEVGFRDLESVVLAECLARVDTCVLATGGGIIERPENLQALAASAWTIWLDVDAETLARRLVASPVRRPLLEGDLHENLRVLLEQRVPTYAAIADGRVTVTDQSIMKVVDEILDLISAQEWLQ